MRSGKQEMASNMSRFDRIDHWCGDSRLHLGPATLSTLTGHIYRCDSNGSCVQEAYASTVEEVVRAYKTILPLDIGNNAQSTKTMPANSEMGFVWIDLHGVPPPPHDTINGSDKGNTMNQLWEALQLNQKHRMRLQEEIRQEYQRRTVMFGKEVDSANTFSYAIPVTHPNNEGDGSHQTTKEGQLTLPLDSECFCTGYSCEYGLEALDDPDTLHLFAKPTSVNCQRGNKEECYASLRLMTLLEHTVCNIPKMKGQIHSSYLTADSEKQNMFHELTYLPKALHDNPFLRSTNSVDVPTSFTNFEDSFHNRGDTDSVKSDSMDHLLLGNDEHSGAMCAVGDGHTRPLQSAITHVFCWEGLCVTWCPRSTSASWNDRGCVWQVKNWSQLRETVLSHCIYSAQHLLQPEAPENDTFNVLERSGRNEEIMTTSFFISLLMSTVCYTYLPNINAMLGEVEAIDFMLPLIFPNMESDQSDAHRRILMLRHRLSIRRRELICKKKLLDSLRGPSVSTLAAFMTQGFPSDHNHRRSPEVSRAMSTSSASAAISIMDAISDTIDQTLHKMDTSRIVLGNTTILYNSSVISSNYEVSNDADYYMVLVHYVFITIMPAHIIIAHWGLNFYVPFKELDSFTPFFVIVCTLVAICILAPIFPFWAYYTRRIHLII